MATATKTTGSRIKPYRLDVRQYLTMLGAGVLPDDAHVELLDGIPIEQMTKYPPHNFSVARLGYLLRQVIPPPWIVREEKSMRLGRFWRPEPDLAVVRGPDDVYEVRDPIATDIGLLVEVSASSYPLDRGPKWRQYAAWRVQVYWIVNLSKRRIEVYGQSSGRGRSATYRQGTIFDDGESVPVVLEGQEIGRVAVADILPRA
jgi:Uma2 family endonuclease